MTRDQKIIAVLAAVIVIGGGVLLFLKFKADADISVADEVSRAKDTRIAELSTSMQDRDKKNEALLEKIDQQKAEVKTVPDAVRVITKYVQVPGQDTPIFAVEPSDLTPKEKAELPSSPGYAIQTQESVVQTAKTLLQCQADQGSLDTCKLDLTDMRSQLAARTDEVKVWKSAAKGGSVAKRLLKIGGCAAAVGGGAATARAFTSDARWIVGAAVGSSAVCALVW